MGLVLENIKYKNLLNTISYRFSRRRVTGIYGEDANYLLDIINGDITDYDGYVILEKLIIDSSFYKEYPRAIALIEPYPNFFTNKVNDEIKFNLDIRNYQVEDLEAKEKEMLDLVGLNEDILNRDIHTLSTSEKYLLSVVINLLYEPDIILFKDVFTGLDHNSKKRLNMIINNLKEDKKIVVVTSNDTNILYDITDEVILLNGNSVYISGTSEKLFTSMELMKEQVIPMPNITKLTYIAKNNKKVKLSFHKDVRDIIKDIYKHV